ncbi:MAG: hypothetical protein ABIP54_02105 [Candidatus Andersenbacteria bacterium]
MIEKVRYEYTILNNNAFVVKMRWNDSNKRYAILEAEGPNCTSSAIKLYKEDILDLVQILKYVASVLDKTTYSMKLEEG